MPSANENLFDASVRHQVGIRRFGAGEVLAILAILESADQDLARLLRRELSKSRLTVVERRFVNKRIGQILTVVFEARSETMRQVRKRLRSGLIGLAPSEAAFEQRLFRAAIPIDVTLNDPSLARLRAVVTSEPFDGRLLRQWNRSLALADRARLRTAITLGVTQQETIPQIVGRVAGTRARGFRDGVLAITRRNAEAVVRTAVNHVSNRARETFWDQNTELIQGLRWTATLDGSTTPICRARDGKVASIGGKPVPEEFDPLSPDAARPPAHVGCRSIMVAVLSPEGVVGKRPFVTDTRRGVQREVDFKKMAREQGRPIADVRREWARRNIGQVPAETTYGQWLNRQSAKFQDQVLGKTRGRLFRRGGLEVEQFVDRLGNELTLAQLARLRPGAFADAGV